MSKLISLLLALFLIPVLPAVYAQNTHSLQLNGGMVFPMNSSKGAGAALQYNYSLSPAIQLYAYSGISYWDENHEIHEMDRKDIQNNQFKTSYSADEHVLIPLYFGSQIALHSDRLFTTFANIELGYSHLSYNAYENLMVTDEKTGEVLEFYADQKTKRKVNENLFGIGAGVGLSHEITNGIKLQLSYKLNTFINSNYNGFFTSRGTYNTLVLGVNCGI
ncbi:MAG: outer membrane beta-barrel protein [Ignavibacteria bacterium]|jgi:opacity protein-like surface antigen|nr:outer membrane beta-barrel protein [Ignavibacteria bacterium]MCU7502132.1 outer membrane beta-barrel protein [Ignavibacteria bacterium]MCU7515534.1 outer membrane beta-barrel protein [Ignavibacteria bacterium]